MGNPEHTITPRAVLDFWFGSPEAPDYGQPRKVWFVKDSEFDRVIGARFLGTYEQAAAGHCTPWQTQAESCLALLLVLDQFPRNLFRGTPQAFATDEKALNIAEMAVERGFDQQLLPVQRWFIYLPFEHSECLAHQERAIAYFETLRGHPPSASSIDYAHRHYDVIRRFGRFPHRNGILGRKNRPAEETFLQQPGSRF